MNITAPLRMQTSKTLSTMAVVGGDLARQLLGLLADLLLGHDDALDVRVVPVLCCVAASTHTYSLPDDPDPDARRVGELSALGVRTGGADASVGRLPVGAVPAVDTPAELRRKPQSGQKRASSTMNTIMVRLRRILFSYAA